MKLSVTIIAGSYRNEPRLGMVGPGVPFPIEQPGDLIVTVSAENMNMNAPLRLVLREMLQETEESLSRMTTPIIDPAMEEPPSDH